MTLAEALAAIPIGTYLRIWGHFPNATNQQCKQGTLKSFDTQTGMVTLESTTYANRLYEVLTNQIDSIETNHTGSGASGSVQTPDKVFNPASGKWQDKTYR